MNHIRKLDIFGEKLSPFRLRSADHDFSRMNTCCVKVRRPNPNQLFG